MRLVQELRKMKSDDLVAVSGGLGLLNLLLCLAIGVVSRLQDEPSEAEAVFSSPWWWGFTAIVWLFVILFAILAALRRDPRN